MGTGVRSQGPGRKLESGQKGDMAMSGAWEKASPGLDVGLM